MEQFYELLAAGTVPTTSTPSPGAFLEAYRSLAGRFESIISIHVMSTKSAVYQVARLAASMMPEFDIKIVDSGQVSAGLGLLVCHAAGFAQRGYTAEAVVNEVEKAKANVSVVAAIRDLTLLRRSGRVSLSKALVAGLLDIKPILRIASSDIVPVESVRAWQRAKERLAAMATDVVVHRQPLKVAVVHTNNVSEAIELRVQLDALKLGFEIDIVEAGPALASHAGPGALGVCILGS